MDYTVFVKEFKADNWECFVIICSKFENEINEMCLSQKFGAKIPEDIKNVACYKLRNNANLWFNQELPALDGIKPIDLFDLQDGEVIVKEILLRLPV